MLIDKTCDGAVEHHNNANHHDQFNQHDQHNHTQDQSTLRTAKDSSAPQTRSLTRSTTTKTTDGSTIEKPTDRPFMDISAFSMQGRRHHMEDFFDIGYQLKPPERQNPNEWPYEYFYFGIFDGHGGSEAAQFAKKNLLKFITQQKTFWSDNDDDVMSAIRTGYAMTHAAMREVMLKWTRANKVLPSTAGTTASILFIKNGKYYTGHVGDSRIVISRENSETKRWISHQVTEDHKPESETEIKRVERAGGEVRCKLGVHRVVWRRPILIKDLESKLTMMSPTDPEFNMHAEKVSNYPVSESLVASYQSIPFLAIARSLGDFWSINPYSGQYIVSPEPDVTCSLIDPNDKCIVLATDGLWNVVNSCQATRFLQELKVVREGKRNSMPFKEDYFTLDNFYDVSERGKRNHALSLVYTAYQIWERRGLRSDNITAVVAMLGDILNPPQYSSQQHRTSPELLQHHEAVPTIVQLDQTNNYCERIWANQVPEFNPRSKQITDDLLRVLDDTLVFPPTVTYQRHQVRGIIRGPVNYDKLSNVDSKALNHTRDTIIYIKRVSDDPADYNPLPTRISASGKEVKDASAQATQSIHDFGQSWHDWDWDRSEYPPVVGRLRAGYVMLDQSLDNLDNLFQQRQTEEEDELGPLAFSADPNIELISDDNIDPDGWKETYLSPVEDDQPKSSSTEEGSMPQLRCLVNRNGSPVSTRSTRSRACRSLTENSKRKAQTNSHSPRTKRRKSHPVQCAT